MSKTLLGDYHDSVVAAARARFTSIPTVEGFVGQFDPSRDPTVSYATPGLFIGIVDISLLPVEKSQVHDANINFAAVIVFDDLNQTTRNTKGWNEVEKFMVFLDGLAKLTPKTLVAVLEGATKVDRPGTDGNAGYSYWTIRWVVPYRWATLAPGDY